MMQPWGPGWWSTAGGTFSHTQDGDATRRIPNKDPLKMGGVNEPVLYSSGVFVFVLKKGHWIEGFLDS